MTLIKKLKQKLKQLKEQLQVLIFAYADKRTPLLAKIIIGITIGYLLSPIDLVPDFIPVLGLLDDLIIVPLLIMLSIRLIPPGVLIDAKQAIAENPQKLKKNNWMFAAGIIVVWMLLVYIIYKQFQKT